MLHRNHSAALCRSGHNRHPAFRCAMTTVTRFHPAVRALHAGPPALSCGPGVSPLSWDGLRWSYGEEYTRHGSSNAMELSMARRPTRASPALGGQRTADSRCPAEGGRAAVTGEAAAADGGLAAAAGEPSPACRPAEPTRHTQTDTQTDGRTAAPAGRLTRFGGSATRAR